MSWFDVGGNVLGSVIGGWSSTYAQKKQDSYNRQAATTEYERSKEATQEAWDRETEYNAPIAQMQRLKEAGLNPNLVYGTGISLTGNTHASPASVPTQIARKAPDYSGSLEKYLTLESLRLNNDIAARTAKNLDADLLGKVQDLKISEKNNAKYRGGMTDNIGGRIMSFVDRTTNDIKNLYPSVKNAYVWNKQNKYTLNQKKEAEIAKGPRVYAEYTGKQYGEKIKGGD